MCVVCVLFSHVFIYVTDYILLYKTKDEGIGVVKHRLIPSLCYMVALSFMTLSPVHVATTVH